MKKEYLPVILFFGALWGILEATLGYVLQFLPPLVSGSVMFPIGATLMIIAFRTTKSQSTIFWVAAIAALIKSVNFLLPGLPPIKTYNPMIAIMLQSLVVFAVSPMIEPKRVPLTLAGLTLASLGWRTLFILNVTINNALTGFPFTMIATPAATFAFIVHLGLMGALFLMLLYYGVQLVLMKTDLRWKPNLVTALPLLVLAVVLTLFL
ncbi:MAG: hypothetical protein EA375_04145 [Acholeplasmataceae bacterium]|nr:MAG: hypothetical protein EA375_04145 [Acholeplasmataceae bacterium]